VKLEQNISPLKSMYESIDAVCIASFADIPLSDKTKKALKEEGFNVPTEIQRESIGLSSQGRDILVCAGPEPMELVLW